MRTGLSGVERDQALLAGSADIDISGSGAQAPTTARLESEDSEELRNRIDDVTSRALRLLALPTDVAPFDDGACRAAVAAAIDRRAVQEALGGAGNALRTARLWTRPLGGGPEDPDPGPDLDAARAAPGGVRAARRFRDGARRARRPGQRGRSPSGRRRSWRRSASRWRSARWTRPTFYATEVGNPDSVADNGYGHGAGHVDARLPDPGVPPRPAGRRAQHPRRSATPTTRGWTTRRSTPWSTPPGAAGTGDEAREAWLAVAAAAERTAAYVPLAETRVQLVAGQRLRNGVVMRPYSGYDLATAG